MRIVVDMNPCQGSARASRSLGMSSNRSVRRRSPTTRTPMMRSANEYCAVASCPVQAIVVESRFVSVQR